ncbi:hypothetical protein BGX28_002154, partial [Mortierella sp. GBA30]
MCNRAGKPPKRDIKQMAMDPRNRLVPQARQNSQEQPSPQELLDHRENTQGPVPENTVSAVGNEEPRGSMPKRKVRIVKT